ncbi:MAG: hypothetical protein Q8S33_30270 [Myxococcales bacterium]|nr:hypothetical protein [Myxococcales bacterium]
MYLPNSDLEVVKEVQARLRDALTTAGYQVTQGEGWALRSPE